MQHNHFPPPPAPTPGHPDYRFWYTDVEPAYEMPAECECQQGPRDACVCVHPTDVENWNQAYELTSAFDDLDPEEIKKLSELTNSASYWNSTYATVSATSGIWNEASGMADVSARLYELSAAIDEVDRKKIYVESASLLGDGTEERPLKVRNYEQVWDVIHLLSQGSEQLSSAYNNMAINMWKCEENMLAHIAGLSAGHHDNYELIKQLRSGQTIIINDYNDLTQQVNKNNINIANNTTTINNILTYANHWQLDNSMTGTNKSTYVNNKTDLTIYYSTYNGDT